MWLLAPDLILESASPTVTGLQELTRTVPIVFVNVIDPVGAGLVASLARPGGNTTDQRMAGNAQADRPRVTRVAVLDSTIFHFPS
jgi:putative ABC transport system substrate-binding protein